MSSLSSFAESEFSQFGEDGMLAEIFSRLGVTDGYFVEFGASNGVRLSNTHKLWRSGWSGCLIEGDPDRYAELCANIDSDRTHLVNEYVQESGPSSVDSILERVGAPHDIDVLSIDVDGDDLALWRGIRRHNVRAVVIEYNPTIPVGVLYENPSGANHGNSASSLIAVGHSLGMQLVAQTRMNLIFLAQEEINLAALEPVQVRSGVSYFFGYDGSLIRSVDGEAEVSEIYRGPWGGYILQPFPKLIRQFGRRDVAKAAYAGFSTLMTRPSQLRQLVQNRGQFTRW